MDTIRFAQLVNWLTQKGMVELSIGEIRNLFEMIQPQIQTHDNRPIVPAVSVNELLAGMQANQKIEAIKAYRVLTNLGLKESKDAVEKYLVVQS